MQECQCELAGYCNRHNLYMTPVMHKICKNRPETYSDNQENPIPVVSGPIFVQKVVNYTVAKTKHVLTGSKEVSEETFKKRMSICSSCPLYIADKKECSKCGCYMEVKAKWSESECPEGLWKSETQENNGGCKSCG